MLDIGGASTKAETVDIRSINTYLTSTDAYICIMTPDHEFNIPVVNGIAFLTGVGEKEELQKLIDIADS